MDAHKALSEPEWNEDCIEKRGNWLAEQGEKV